MRSSIPLSAVPNETGERLLISGWLPLAPPGNAPVEVRRGMVVLAREGTPLGTVAAVVAAAPDPPAALGAPTFTHLVLGRCLPNPEYRLVPQALIVQVDAAAVQLRLSRPDVDQLPRRTTL